MHIKPLAATRLGAAVLVLLLIVTGCRSPYLGLVTADDSKVSTDAATVALTFATGDSLSAVTGDLTLPTTGTNGSTIAWTSDTPAVVSDTGTVVRPTTGSADATVVLTATITKGNSTTTKTVTVTVKAQTGAAITATATTTAQALTVGSAMTSFSPLAASGGTTPYVYSVTSGTLPAGLSLDAATGSVTGTPTTVQAAADVVFSVKDAGNVVASATSTVSFVVGAAVVTPMVLTGTVSHLAGGLGLANTNATGTAARFNYPNGMAYANGYLYVADASNNQIRRVEVATQAVTLFAGGAAGFADGVGALATFNGPQGVATDGTNLYVADAGNELIRKIEIATQTVTTFAGQQGNTTPADGIGTAAAFHRTWAIACDGTNLYVLDTMENQLRKIVLATADVSTVTLTGPATLVGTGMTAGRFLDSPNALTTDGTFVYVVGGSYSVIKVSIATGAVSLVAGSGTPGTADGVGAAATFLMPYGVVYHGGTLYVNDGYHVRKIDLATSAVTTIAGGGTGASASVLAPDGTSTCAQFVGLLGITTDGSSLYVSDTDDNNGWESAIRRIQ